MKTAKQEAIETFTNQKARVEKLRLREKTNILAEAKLSEMEKAMARNDFHLVCDINLCRDIEEIEYWVSLA